MEENKRRKLFITQITHFSNSLNVAIKIMVSNYYFLVANNRRSSNGYKYKKADLGYTSGKKKPQQNPLHFRATRTNGLSFIGGILEEIG